MNAESREELTGIDIKSFANENVNNEFRVSIVIPAGNKLEAVEVK